MNAKALLFLELGRIDAYPNRSTGHCPVLCDDCKTPTLTTGGCACFVSSVFQTMIRRVSNDNPDAVLIEFRVAPNARAFVALPQVGRQNRPALDMLDLPANVVQARRAKPRVELPGIERHGFEIVLEARQAGEIV